MSPAQCNHLLQQGDLYHRPNRCGYTRHLHEAGLYTEAEAKRVEGYRRVPLDRAIRVTEEHVAALEQQIVALASQVAAFRAVTDYTCPSCRRTVPREFHLCRTAEPPFTGLDDGPSLGGRS